MFWQNSGKRRKEKGMYFYGNQYPDIEQKNKLLLQSGKVGPYIKLIFNSEISTFLHLFNFLPIQQMPIDGLLCAGYCSGCPKNSKDDEMDSFQAFVVLRCKKGVHITEQGRVSAEHRMWHIVHT